MSQFAGLIAGLGNPGPEYERTRHNYGFMAVDLLLEGCGGADSCARVDAGGDCVAHKVPVVRSKPAYVAAKPMTFMNLSGLAVGRICRRFSIPPRDVIVIHDDLDLPLGTMKLKLGGGDAGHNGIRSVTEHLGGPGFYRLRLGIGRPESSRAGSDYVLSPFGADELSTVRETLEEAVAGLKLMARRGHALAQQRVNAFAAATIK